MTKLLPVFYQVHSLFTALAVVPTQLGHTIVNCDSTGTNVSYYSIQSSMKHLIYNIDDHLPCALTLRSNC